MDVSIALPTKANSWEIVMHAEQLGFSHAWFYDTPMINAELFASMGASAVKTSTIKLCTGVLVPSNRISPVAASGLATLNALAPGRVVFGVATGDTGRRSMGLKPITLEEMEAYIAAVRGLLAGDTVECELEGTSRKVRFLNPDTGLVNIDDHIPLAMSALGPKSRALAAKLGAQWMTLGSLAEQDPGHLDEFRALWVAEGRSLDDLYTVLVVGGRVLDDEEEPDSGKALQQAGPPAALVFHTLIEQEAGGTPVPGWFPFQEEVDLYRKIHASYEPADARYLSNHRGHLMFLRPEESHITGQVIKALTMTGTKAELIPRLRALKDRGFDQIQFHTVPGHEHEMMERWADVMADV